MAEGEAARAEADGKWEARKQRILQAARRMRKQAEKPNGLLLRSRSALDPNHADRRGDIREVWDKARQDHREFVQLLASDLDEIGQVAREALKPLRSFRLLFGGMIRKGRWISAVQDRECARRE